MCHIGYMERDAFADLKTWKDAENRRPLILRGARQVGKTWLVRKLAGEFDHFLEINFEEHPQIGQFFSLDLDPHRIVKELSLYFGESLIPGSSLLFFDEIQIEPKAIVALRYFFEKMPDLHVVAAGSLIEFELEKISFPVGRVEFLYLYPLSFGEFLQALGKYELRNLFKSEEPFSSPIHEQLKNLFRDYTILGGMPAVLDYYIRHEDVSGCRRIQTSIIETFYADFPKYARTHRVKYVETVFSSVPVQLGRKFKYANVSTLYKSRELKEALDLLEKASLIHRVYHSSANGIPLYAEGDDKKFKVIFFDTGLALNVLNIPLKEFFGEYDLSLINEGAVAEQVVGQELVAFSPRERKPALYYWHREAKSSNAEVDYLLESGNSIIPLEVKRGVKGRIRSLKLFMEEKKRDYGVVLSNSSMGREGNIEYLPFHGMERLSEVL